MAKMTQQMILSDFLTEHEIRQVARIYHSTKNVGGTAAQIEIEIIEPNIDRINKKLGRENNPLYLAYACEYVMMRTKT